MKIRSGFVSNSSTSSFIMVGFNANELETLNVDKKKLKSLIIEKFNIDENKVCIDSIYELTESLGLDHANEGQYIGKRIVPFPEDNIEEYDVLEFVGSIDECHKKVKEFCNKIGINPKIKIIGGIEAS